MRVLFATTAGAGHFGPAIPVAQACVEAGHEVLVAAPVSFAEQVRRAGFAHRAFPDVAAAVMAAVFARLPSLPRQEANRIVISEVFGRLDAQAALPDLLELMADWRPDVVVRDPAEFGSMAAAARFEIPDTQVAIGLGVVLDDVGAWLDEPLRELADLAGVPGELGIDRVLDTPTFTSVPASLDELSPEARPAGPVWRFRTPVQVTGPALPAQWGDPDQPLVYVSFGSVAGSLGGFVELYAATLAALADLPVRVLMTTGAGLEPDDLGPPPANTHVTTWWPQQNAMPAAALVVGHGGFGTTMSAVRAGVPQIVMPLFSADQFINADRISAVGAGEQLPRGLASVDALPGAVTQVLTGDRYSRVARGLADEAARLSDLSTIVTALEDLAASWT